MLSKAPRRSFLSRVPSLLTSISLKQSLYIWICSSEKPPSPSFFPPTHNPTNSPSLSSRGCCGPNLGGEGGLDPGDDGLHAHVVGVAVAGPHHASHPLSRHNPQSLPAGTNCKSTQHFSVFCIDQFRFSCRSESSNISLVVLDPLSGY